MAVTTVVFAQVFQALAIRSNTESLFRQGLLSNRALLISAAAVVILQLIVIYMPILQRSAPCRFHRCNWRSLRWPVVLWVVEIEKAFRRRK